MMQDADAESADGLSAFSLLPAPPIPPTTIHRTINRVHRVLVFGLPLCA